MPRMCELCGKKTTFGNTIARRGRAKYLGGVGVKTTGITRRKFVPNLQKIRVKTADGTVKRITICTQCLRHAHIVKPPARPRSEIVKGQAAAVARAEAKATALTATRARTAYKIKAKAEKAKAKKAK